MCGGRIAKRRIAAAQECLLVAKVLGFTGVDVDSNDPVDESIPGEGIVFKEGPVRIPPVPPGTSRAAGSRIGVHFRDALGDIHFLSLPKYKYHVALHILNDHTTFQHFSGTGSFQYFLADCETGWLSLANPRMAHHSPRLQGLVASHLLPWQQQTSPAGLSISNTPTFLQK